MIRPGAAALAALALAAGPVVGQTPDAEEPGTLRGRVVDAVNGAPLANARIVWEGLRGGTLTDSLGRFALEGVAGEGALTVDHYGYGLTTWGVRATGPVTDLGELRLQPDPLLVGGVTVIADRLATAERRLRNRRNATPVAVRALGQERLTVSAARDVADFLRLEGGLFPTQCRGWTMAPLCVYRRGRVVEPRVYIDEAPVIGGLDQLATYQPHELHLVEIYSSGLEIRAYTRQFMERMVRRPRALMPIVW